MTVDEMRTAVNGAVTSDDCLSLMPDILGRIEADYARRDTLENENEDLRNRLREAQDRNAKMYLQIVGADPSTDEEDVDDLDGMDYVDAYFDKLAEAND